MSSRGINSTHRKLDDEDLDSADDEDRLERVDDDVDDYGKEEETQARPETILDVDIGRHAIPRPSDGEVRGITPGGSSQLNLMIAVPAPTA